MESKDTIHAAFEKDGFYHAKGLFDADTIRALEKDYDAIVAQLEKSGEEINARWDSAALEELEGKGKRTRVIHTHNVQKYSAHWLRAFLDERFVHVCTAILGEDVVLHHSKLFMKPALHGSPFPLHQDWPYFPSPADSMIAGIIHISEADDSMGCVRVVPGSHKLGRLDKADAIGDNAKDGLAGMKLEDAIPVECEPGDVVFFHYFTLHGSMPNRSEKVRKTVLAQVHEGHDLPDAHKHPNERLVLNGFNHTMTRKSANLTTA